MINFHNILILIFSIKILIYAHHWLCSTLKSTEVLNILVLVCILPKITITKNIKFFFWKNGYQFSFVLVLIAKCINKNLKQNQAAILPISNLSSFLTITLLWILRVQYNRPLKKNHDVYVIVDLFSNYIVPVPTPKDQAYHAVNSIIYHKLSKFGPLKNLIAYRGTEYLSPERPKCFTLLKIRHCPKTSNAPWRNGDVEVQNEYLGTHLRMFFLTVPKTGLFKYISMLMPQFSTILTFAYFSISNSFPYATACSTDFSIERFTE